MQLDLPYGRAGVCHHECCTHSPQQVEQSTECAQAAENDTFHDAPLIPHTRRKHRRLRKHQRIRARKRDNASERERETFRRATRRLGPTQNASVQTQSTGEITQCNTNDSIAGKTEEGEAESVIPLQECQQHVRNLQHALTQQRQLCAKQESSRRNISGNTDREPLLQTSNG